MTASFAAQKAAAVARILEAAQRLLDPADLTVNRIDDWLVFNTVDQVMRWQEAGLLRVGSHLDFLGEVAFARCELNREIASDPLDIPWQLTAVWPADDGAAVAADALGMAGAL